MNWLNVVGVTLNLALVIIVWFGRNYIKKLADIVTAREEGYESEKGKNLATREDIEELTAKMESVRSEISLEVQRRNDAIVQQEKRLLNVAYYAQSVMNAWNNVLLFSKHSGNVNQMYDIIKDINDDILNLSHTSNIILATYQAISELDVLVSLEKTVGEYGLEICAKAQNIATILDISNQISNISQSTETYADSMTRFTKEYMPKINEILEKKFLNKQASEQALYSYVIWLNKLYKKEFNIKCS